MTAGFLSAGIALAVWLGFKALDALTRLIATGWLNEFSATAIVSLTLITFVLTASNLADQHAPSPWLVGITLPWTGSAMVTYVLALGRPPSLNPAPRLLVLRVFDRERSRLKLLDELQSRWRYVGPVSQIGGPDLATTNVDLYECAMFLVGRLHDLFLSDAGTPEQLASRLQVCPDREGRHSISEVFCFNSAWQATVEHLIEMSNAIVLDLRGLTAQRGGISYELRALARSDHLDRVLGIGDARTDWTVVDRVLGEEGHQPLSLNRCVTGAKLPADPIFDQLLSIAQASQFDRPT